MENIKFQHIKNNTSLKIVIIISKKSAQRDEIQRELDKSNYLQIINKWRKIKRRDFHLVYAKEITRDEPIFRDMRKSMTRMSRDELRELSAKIKPVIITSRTESVCLLPQRKSRSSIKLSITYPNKEKLRVRRPLY